MRVGVRQRIKSALWDTVVSLCQSSSLRAFFHVHRPGASGKKMPQPWDVLPPRQGLAHGRCWGVDRSQRRGAGGTVVSHAKSWSPPAPPPTLWYGAATGLGRGSRLYGARRHPSRGERETHHPLRSDTASSLDAIKPGRHRRLQQRATAPGGSQTRASQCGASLSTPSIPEI